MASLCNTPEAENKIISNNNKNKEFVCESICLCTNSRQNGYQIWYGARTHRGNLFKNRSGFLKIQILSDFFLIFSIIFLMDCIFSSKYCSVLTESNRTENSLLNTMCCLTRV